MAKKKTKKAPAKKPSKKAAAKKTGRKKRKATTAPAKKKRRGHKSPPRRKTEDIETSVRKPKNWDKAVSAAYLRVLGSTQADTAKSVGVSERTVRSWEGSKWWPNAESEARNRWLKGIVDQAMAGLSDVLANRDANTVRWVLERRMPEFAPPKMQHHVGISLKDLDAETLADMDEAELAALDRICSRLAGRRE